LRFSVTRLELIAMIATMPSVTIASVGMT